MRAFRLNRWQLGIIAAAVVCVAGAFAYLDYRSFEADARGYVGVTFEDTRKMVGYRLGYPDVVYEPEPDSHSSRVYYTDRDKAPISAMPQDKDVDDYNEWGFFPSGDRAAVNVEFNAKTGQVVTVTCIAKTGFGKQCPSLFGIRSGDTEVSVLSKLGNPNRESFSGVAKTIRYDDIGVNLNLAKEQVYGMSSFAPKGDSRAIIRRYLKARLGIDL